METISARIADQPPDHGLGLVAIVGRPNVGKSTLFNRLTRGRNAIVHNLPGVTRDRNYGKARWEGKEFSLIDTGGLEAEPDTDLKRQVQTQSRFAIQEADAVLVLFDGRAGLNPLDREAVKFFRQVKKPIFFGVNKIDTQSRENLLYEFYDLGLTEIFPLSAEHGLGLEVLMERVMGALTGLDGPRKGEATRSPSVCLAVVGRPNVGKSTLVNRLLGAPRSVVDSEPGTTRDSLDSPFTWGDGDYTLVDTAGIRRRARITDGIERSSATRSLRSVDRGDVVVQLLDGPEGMTSQDAQIMAYAAQRGKGLVIAVNKWDLLPKNDGGAGSGGPELGKRAFLDYAPTVFISALTGYGIPKLMEAVERVATSQQRWIRTSTLNQALRDIVRRQGPPSYRGRPVKFYYATQTGVLPPTFTLFVNLARGIPTHYERYLAHQLRLSLGLANAPIRIQFRARREEGGTRKK